MSARYLVCFDIGALDGKFESLPRTSLCYVGYNDADRSIRTLADNRFSVFGREIVIAAGESIEEAKRIAGATRGYVSAIRVTKL